MNLNEAKLRRRELVLAALAALGSGCGGVDSGGTGTGAPTFSTGPISGFGSIIVGGVRYDESDATIVDDEGRSFTAPLALGMQTEITASEILVDPLGVSRAVCRTVKVVSQLIGSVESVDTTLLRFTVVGQVVQVNGTTAFDAAIGGFANLVVGQRVEVHALLNVASSRFVASRVDGYAGPDGDKLVGSVASLSLSRRMVTVGGLYIDWSGVDVAEPARVLAPGRFVRVRLAPGTGTTRRATAIGSAVPALEDRDRFEIEGRISAFVSNQSFAVNGIPVDASQATFSNGSTTLALGTKVEVKGALRNGTLIAREVELEEEESSLKIELHGTIQAVDPATQTFRVKGVTVAWSASTRFGNRSAKSLTVGRGVEVKGALAADGTTVTATTIEFGDA